MFHVARIRASYFIRGLNTGLWIGLQISADWAWHTHNTTDFLIYEIKSVGTDFDYLEKPIHKLLLLEILSRFEK